MKIKSLLAFSILLLVPVGAQNAFAGGACNSPADCNDGNSCTNDHCELDILVMEFRCLHDGITPTGRSCSDGNGCTIDDVCGGGACVGFPISLDSCGNSATTSCSGPDFCDLGVCNPNNKLPGTVCGAPPSQCHGDQVCDGIGSCSGAIPLFDVPCDDGNECSENDTCIAGLCVGRPPQWVVGDLLKPCGDPLVGPCTGFDYCVGMVCVSDNFDDIPCNDGNECTLGDTCIAGACIANSLAQEGASCGDQSDTECANPNTCSAIGVCLPNDELLGTLCNDDKECTTGDTCVAGDCVGVPQIGNKCGDQTLDQCNLPDICDFTGTCLPNLLDDTPCEDGDLCTINDLCAEGICTKGDTDISIPLCTPDEDGTDEAEISILPHDDLTPVKTFIPDWVKNTAGWWAERSVEDSDFTGGISFLIEEDIISIPDLPAATEAAEEIVPDWVRNMAGWWADDLTTDQEFADAIKYLVEKGIIQVKT